MFDEETVKFSAKDLLCKAADIKCAQHVLCNCSCKSSSSGGTDSCTPRNGYTPRSGIAIVGNSSDISSDVNDLESNGKHNNNNESKLKQLVNGHNSCEETSTVSAEEGNEE